MNALLQIMIALSILVPPQGTREVRFHQRNDRKEYVEDLEFVLRPTARNKYVLTFYDRSAGAPEGKSAAPDLSVAVVSASKHEYLITPVGKDTHPYLTGKKQNLPLSKFVEIPAGGDFANAATLKQILFPRGDGLIRLTHDKTSRQLIVKWPSEPGSTSEWVLSYK